MVPLTENQFIDYFTSLVKIFHLEVTLVLWTSRLGIWCLAGKGGHYV